jgi:DNA-binding ferritin-like protein (Dps family)
MAQSKKPRKKTADTSPPPAVDETPENLDKVRDILFGGQMRAVESRLKRIEERLRREHEALRSDLEKQIQALEKQTRKDTDGLAEKLNGEQMKRGEDIKGVSAALRDTARSIEKRLAKLDESSNAADAEIRSQLLEHMETTAAQLRELTERFTADLQTVATELRAEKVDIASMVELFSDMAVRLSEDLQAPTDT